MVTLEGPKYRDIRRPIYRVGRDLCPSLPDAWELREILPSRTSPVIRPNPEFPASPWPQGAFHVDPEA